MKKVKKIILIILLIIFILSTNFIVSNATGETFKVSLDTTAQVLEKGQEFQVSITFSDISTTKGFTLVEGKLEYNQNILEYISGKEEFVGQKDISGIQELNVSTYEDDGSNISISYLDANVKGLRLSFRVRDNSTSLNTSIKLSNLKASNIDDSSILATAPDASLDLNIKQNVETVTLNKTSLTIKENESEILIASILPENATNKEVTWSSSDSSIAEVENGKVTGKKIGSATITVTTQDGAKKATCAVEVQPILVQSISLDKTSLIMKENESVTLTPYIIPENATNKEVTWSSSNNEVAEVIDGKIVAKKAGNVVITATTVEGGKTATCTIEVSVVNIPVEAIKLNKTTVTIKEDQSETLVANILPLDSTEQELVWTSSDTSIVDVLNGIITGKKKGNATITVATKDGTKTATCLVTVEEQPIEQKASDEQQTQSTEQDANTEESEKKEDSKASTIKLPYTGINLILPIGIIATAGIAIITFIKNKKFQGIK